MQNDGSWLEISQHGAIAYNQLRAKFDNADALWKQMIRSNWIIADKNAPSVTAAIVPKDQRTLTDLGIIVPMQKTLESWLDSLYLHDMDTRAAFLPDIRVREGWLTLSPQISNTTLTKVN